MLTTTGALRALWAVLMVLVAAVLVGVGNVAYTNYVQRQGEQRQSEQKASEERAREASRQQTLRIVCAWLEPQIVPDPPPVTPRGRKQLAANQEFYEFLRCKEMT